jgi:hypothetical protein
MDKDSYHTHFQHSTFYKIPRNTVILVRIDSNESKGKMTICAVIICCEVGSETRDSNANRAGAQVYQKYHGTTGIGFNCTIESRPSSSSLNEF